MSGNGRFDRYTLATGPQPARGLLLEFRRIYNIMCVARVIYDLYTEDSLRGTALRRVMTVMGNSKKVRCTAMKGRVGDVCAVTWRGGVKNKIGVPATIGCKRITRIYIYTHTLHDPAGCRRISTHV